MKRAVVLFSGGLDSAVAAIWTRELDQFEISGLFVDYGQWETEYVYARRFAAAMDIPLRMVHVKNLFEGRTALASQDARIPAAPVGSIEQQVTIVPNRNGIFIMLGIAEAIMLGAERVVTGIQLGGRVLYPDNRPNYLASAHALAALSNDPVGPELRHPFSEFEKFDIVRAGSNMQVPFELTWSCYARESILVAVDDPIDPDNYQPAHCGICKACQTRRRAFKDAGIEDPTIYKFSEP